MGCVETMDNKELTKLLSSFVMSDGGVYYSGKNCRYIRNQLAKHEDYLTWMQGILGNVTTCNLVAVNDNRDNRQPSLRLMTRTHPKFTKIRERFYTGSYKGVDPHYLKIFDWQCAAILYMDDGGLSTDPRSPNYYTINIYTKRLSYGDTLLLKKAFKDKLGVEFNIRKEREYYYMTLRRKDAETFIRGVIPHMFPSFEYKLTYPDGRPLISTEGDDIVRPPVEAGDIERNHNAL